MAEIFCPIKFKGGYTDEDKKKTIISAGTERRTAKEAQKEYHHYDRRARNPCRADSFYNA